VGNGGDHAASSNDGRKRFELIERLRGGALQKPEKCMMYVAMEQMTTSAGTQARPNQDETIV